MPPPRRSAPQRALNASGLLAGGVLLTVLTSQGQREGPELAIYNHECGTLEAPCLEPRRAAGLPLQYWFDTPGVSVQHQLALGEDRIRWTPFALDAVFFAGLLAIAARAARRLRRSA